MALPFADYVVLADVPALSAGGSAPVVFNVPAAVQPNGDQRPILFFVVNASGNADLAYTIDINGFPIMASPWTFKSPQPQGLGVGYWIPFEVSAHNPKSPHINVGANTATFNVVKGVGSILFQSIVLMFQHV